MKTHPLISFWKYSTGSLLLALATVFFISNLVKVPLDFVPVREPIFGLPLPTLFWVLGAIMALTSLICLFGEQTMLPLGLVSWLSLNLLLLALALPFLGATGGIQGYLGQVADYFDQSTKTTSSLLAVAVWLLFIGSLVTMPFAWASEKIKRAEAAITLKMSCPDCGIHIKFARQNLGQKIPCPQCQKIVTLRRPEEKLKMSCFFCQEHIEFPPHAIGEKMPCPHCKMGITLKEPE
jgi:hypothetical protein